VDVSLIELTSGLPFAVAAGVAGNVPNSGTASWTFPSSHPWGGPCEHTYQFYVQEVTQITWIYGPRFTVVCGVPVAIDIKPGSDPNAINLGSAGTIPVAILSTPDFNAPNEVDPATLRLAGAAVNVIGRSGKAQCSAQDVSNPPDGLLDLVCHFETFQAIIETGDTVAVLEGQTFAGRPIRGEDAIKIVP
jgi:hypothetical protein